MSENYGSDTKSALEAKIDAQKIAFAPIVFQAVKSLRNLGILELLNSSENGMTPKEIAQKINISEYGIKVLLDAGLSAEVVILSDEKYTLTKTGFYFLNDKMTNINMDFVNDVCYNGMFYLEESVREEKPEGLKVFGNWPTIYHGLSELPETVKESWFAFDHFYSDHVFKSILSIIFDKDRKKVLDVGGNTGKFSLECAEYNPNAEITIMDLPGQLNVALENAKKAGFEKQIKGYPTDILDHSQPFPTGFDAIWMSQFLDCFSEENILQILKRAAQSMTTNTSLFILETYWDRQQFDISTFCLNNTSLYFTAMANGNSRMYHSEDMIRLIEQAGLKIKDIRDNLGVSHTLIECKI
ncbi:MAG: methyltransferase domain-containing protein [Bacteroidetes bacterium]|nr:methyltransferase domain-containing protein [Bacteroidota bacterium]